MLDELRNGDETMVEKRVALVQPLPVIQLNEEVEELIDVYGRRLGLTGKATADVPHFAFAVAYEMDYLVTWNCSHIANRQVMQRLLDLNVELKRFTPTIVTPESLLDRE